MAPAPLDENGNPRQGAFVPLYFASKSLDPEKHGKWDTAEAECYAIVLGFRKFAPWLLGSEVIVHSDHANLRWLPQHSKQYGKLSRWLSYLSLFDMTFEFNRGLSMGVVDYLSRAPQPDSTMPDDGEAEKEKILTNRKGQVVLESVQHKQQHERDDLSRRVHANDAQKLEPTVLVDSHRARSQFACTHGGDDSCGLQHRATRPLVSTVRPDEQVAAQQLPTSRVQNPSVAMGDRITMFSVCAGIGSGQMAVKQAGLAVDTIGICEGDEEQIAIFPQENPGVPVYGDIGVVLEAVLAGDLLLNPDILELTVPCQARSQARVLADWSDTVHPHARLYGICR